MAGRGLERGSVWLHRFTSPDKRRPVVVLTRPDLIGALHTVTVAPITSIIRGGPSEVLVGISEGLKHDSVVNLNHVRTVEKADLSNYIGRLDDAKMAKVCRALALAVGCKTMTFGSGISLARR